MLLVVSMYVMTVKNQQVTILPRKMTFIVEKGVCARMAFMKHKRILLGVTGGIAAYKSAEIIRRLQDLGAEVRVVMTRAAKEFITKMTLQALSGHEVHDDLLDEKAEAAMGHIELGRWADVMLIAPASADFIAKLNQGRADDLLSAICLVTTAPVMIAPAMNHEMWKKAVTQENLASLTARGIVNLGVGSGYQACGELGEGRMLESQQIVDQVAASFQNNALSGKHVLITAGPTREMIDPVRFLSNRSSGKMGYAIAEAVLSAGAAVTLVSGPVCLEPPGRAKTIYVESTEEMMNAVEKQECDIFISVAAVSDYRVKQPAAEKMKKSDDPLTLELVANPDILKSMALKNVFCVGFAAETKNPKEFGLKKLKEKNLDMICVNDVSKPGLGFDSNENALTVIFKSGEAFELEQAPKSRLARELVALIVRGLIKIGTEPRA